MSVFETTAFACPSIYEPLGIVNLEAMACGAAVVPAVATGGATCPGTSSGFPSPLRARSMKSRP